VPAFIATALVDAARTAADLSLSFQAQSSWRPAQVPAVAWDGIGFVTLTAAASWLATRRGATSIHHHLEAAFGRSFCCRRHRTRLRRVLLITRGTA
jgi:hypothetical protein